MVTALARIEGRPRRRHRQQPDAPRGRDRRRRRRQGGALHPALRRLRSADRSFSATRPASWSGPRSRRRALVRHAARHVRRRREPHGAVLSRSCCARATGSARMAMAGGSFKAPALHRGVADRRVRRHGPRGRGEARLPEGDRGARRPRRAACALRAHGRAHVRATARRVSAASHFEIDDVIDPMETRRVITSALAAVPSRRAGPPRSGRASTRGDRRTRERAALVRWSILA